MRRGPGRQSCDVWHAPCFAEFGTPFFIRRNSVETKIAQKMVLAALAVSGAAFAQTQPAPAPAPEPASSLSYNVGVVTDYRYRGISQSARAPALQGGVDYADKSGWYVGTWASTIKWIKDSSFPGA